MAQKRYSRYELSRSFVPKLLINYITHRVVRGKEHLTAKSFFFHGVCLIVDISGFTALSEGFCDAGKKGIDGLQVCTNGYIGGLVAIVHAHGGDIIKFAGDALICVFAEDDFSTTSISQKQKLVAADVLLRAMTCAKEVRSVRTDRLTVHVGMSCGEMCFGILGGVENRWECLISGPCIHELSQCLDDAPSMQAVMTSACWTILLEQGQLVGAKQDGTCILSLESTDGKYEVTLQALPSENRKILDISVDITQRTEPPFSSEPVTPYVPPDASQKGTIDALTRQFVPAPIVEELDSATGLSYFAEIREVVTMFMKWDSYDVNDKHHDLLELQPCFYQAQRILQSTGAYLRQFLVDDKGCVLIACWGMPNMSYLDNAHRALASAVEIRSQLDALTMKTSVGITCADVYCGTVGSMERMEYAAIGSEVNMAARIMGKAKGRLLVGETAYKNLPKEDRDVLDAIDRMKVKGKTEPLQAYNYDAARSRKIDSAVAVAAAADFAPACKASLLKILEDMTQKPAALSSRSHSKSAMSGAHSHSRSRSRRGSFGSFSAALSGSSGSTKSALQTQPSSAPAKLTLIKGKFGTGKSSAVAWLRARAVERRIPTITTRLIKQVGKKKPYSLWKKIFYQMCARAETAQDDGHWLTVNELLHAVFFPDMAQLTELVSLAALTEALGVSNTSSSEKSQGHDSPLTPASQPVTPAATTKKPTTEQDEVYLRDALVKIFVHIFNLQPTLLIIENVHLAGERCLDLLVNILSKINHPSAIVLTAAVADTPAAINAQTAAVTESDFTTVQANALEGSAWYRKYRQILLNHKNIVIIMLNHYSKDEIEALLCKALHVKVAPAELLQLVLDFSGGSFFWVREILQFIKEHGLEKFMSAVSVGPTSPMGSEAGNSLPNITAALSSNMLLSPSRSLSISRFNFAAGERAVISPHQAQLDKLVLARFNGVSPEAQRVLRTASVIGVTFEADVLLEILPQYLKSDMMNSLQALVNQLWLKQDPDKELVFSFLHPHTQQLVYDLTPSSERNHLYAQIAAFVERTRGDDVYAYAALSHYYLHCDTDKALQYVVKAETVLLIVNQVYEFSDAVNLLSNSIRACKTSHDIAVLQKLCGKCRTAIQTFRNRPTPAFLIEKPPAKGFLLRLFTSCVGRNAAQVGPQLLEDGLDRNGSLDANELDAQALFLREIQEVEALLEETAADIECAAGANATPVEAKDWQMRFLR